MKNSSKPTVQSVITYISQATGKKLRLLNVELESIGWKLEPLHINPDPQPRWDAAQLTLFYGTNLIRTWNPLARNQISILEAFEKFCWARKRVDYGHYAYHLRGQKMHDTLSRLNRQQKSLRFFYSGKRTKVENEWIRWEPFRCD